MYDTNTESIAQNNGTVKGNSDNDPSMDILVTKEDLNNENIDNVGSSTATTADSIERENCTDSTPCKKRKMNVCVSCLGALQEEFWPDTFIKIKDMISKKGYVF